MKKHQVLQENFQLVKNGNYQYDLYTIFSDKNTIQMILVFIQKVMK